MGVLCSGNRRAAVTQSVSLLDLQSWLDKSHAAHGREMGGDTGLGFIYMIRVYLQVGERGTWPGVQVGRLFLLLSLG